MNIINNKHLAGLEVNVLEKQTLSINFSDLNYQNSAEKTIFKLLLANKPVEAQKLIYKQILSNNTDFINVLLGICLTINKEYSDALNIFNNFYMNENPDVHQDLLKIAFLFYTYASLKTLNQKPENDIYNLLPQHCSNNELLVILANTTKSFSLNNLFDYSRQIYNKDYQLLLKTGRLNYNYFGIDTTGLSDSSTISLDGLSEKEIQEELLCIYNKLNYQDIFINCANSFIKNNKSAAILYLLGDISVKKLSLKQAQFYFRKALKYSDNLELNEVIKNTLLRLKNINSILH